MVENKKEVVVGNEVDTIAVPKVEWEKVLADLHELKNPQIVPVVTTKRVTEHTAKMRVHNGVPVIAVTQVNGKLDEFGKEILHCKLLLDDNTSVEVEYLKFLNDTYHQYTVLIKKQLAEKKERVRGQFRKRNELDQVTSDLVDDVETYVEYTNEVEFVEGPLTGKVITVGNTALNI